MTTSLIGNVWYVNSTEEYTEIMREYKLPSWDFAPWGIRSHCYLLGLMMGYILHTYKDVKFKIDSMLNIVIWQIVILIGLSLAYGPYWIDTVFEWKTIISHELQSQYIVEDLT